MKRSIILGGLVAALAAFSFGTVSAQEGGEDARVRVLHASPDAPAVDIYVEGAEAVSNLAFGDITGYLDLPAGDYGVEVFPAGAGGEGDAVISATLTLDAGTDYTVAAVGLLDSIEPLVLIDDNSAPAEGQAHVRFVHASPDAPAVDISAAGAGVVISDVAFQGASDYLPLPAGSYDLDVLVSGTDTAALSVPGVAVEGGNVYTIFALGLADGTPELSAKAVLDSTHAAPSAPHTGTGMASDGGNSVSWLALMVVAAIGVMGVTAGTIAVRRSAVRS
jgi:hypothetical protein